MKYNRHARILDIIDKYEIETQDELAEKLRELGMDVTQATISVISRSFVWLRFSPQWEIPLFIHEP